MRVSTIIRSHDDPDKVKDSVTSIFPDWEPSNFPEKSSFPVTRSSEVISAEIQSIDGLISILRENRVLDRTGCHGNEGPRERDGVLSL